MWIRGQLKSNAKIAFKRNYWKCVLVALLFAICTGSCSSGSAGTSNTGSFTTGGYEDSADIYFDDDSFYSSEAQEIKNAFIAYAPIIFAVALVAVILGSLLSIFVFGPLQVGCCNFFKLNAQGDADLNALSQGFKKNCYWKMVGTMFTKALFTRLWTFLFIIPGIIKAYEYRMIPYILADAPQIARKDAFRISKEMMKGNKMDAFVLDLSFIGWEFLSLCTCGILGIFYVNPYINATNAELFIAVREEYFHNRG